MNAKCFIVFKLIQQKKIQLQSNSIDASIEHFTKIRRIPENCTMHFYVYIKQNYMYICVYTLFYTYIYIIYIHIYIVECIHKID